MLYFGVRNEEITKFLKDSFWRNNGTNKKIILDDISSNSNYNRKNNYKLTRLNKTVIRKKNNSKKNRINSAQTYNNKALFKYSLKDVLNMENPIKILL